MGKHTPKLMLDDHGHIYCAEHRKHAPFTDSDGNYHPDYHDGLVALPYGCSLEVTSRDVAELIVKAVNHHAELVAALENIMTTDCVAEHDNLTGGHCDEPDCWIEKARAVLAKVKP